MSQPVHMFLKASTSAPKDIWSTISHTVHRETGPPWAGTGPVGKWKPTPGNCRRVSKCKWQNPPPLWSDHQAPLGQGGGGKSQSPKRRPSPVSFHHFPVLRNKRPLGMKGGALIQCFPSFGGVAPGMQKGTGVKTLKAAPDSTPLTGVQQTPNRSLSVQVPSMQGVDQERS